MIKEIHIIDCNNDLIMTLRELFEEERAFRFRNINPDKLELSLKSIPSLIIINEESINEDVLELCEKIRKNEDNSITPIIVITADDSKEHKIDILERSVEYVISKKEIKDYLYYIIKNLSRLLTVNRTVSPLTGLPGNLPIQTELKKRLLKKEPFVVLYIDLDNFKAYNDVYGFLKGDEIIKLTAKIITKHIHALESTDAFVGHIGGDDFVAITNDDIDYEAICQDIIAEFDVEGFMLFMVTDIDRKYIEVQNRKGVMELFPLTSISRGEVVADDKRFSNTLEIGEVGAQVKHLSKTTMGSSYAIDRREEND